ncbi:hypothetical protein [Halomonas sp. NO4]|uniref:hypothetical protein n=1 Tax=Halomonas sp. NO4 TaxID=2484813 RepID=UPI0013D6D8E2|nr:hypothetical protein [Halomonas sp. NO4]
MTTIVGFDRHDVPIRVGSKVLLDGPKVNKDRKGEIHRVAETSMAATMLGELVGKPRLTLDCGSLCGTDQVTCLDEEESRHGRWQTIVRDTGWMPATVDSPRNE